MANKSKRCPCCKNTGKTERRYRCSSGNCTWCGGENLHECYHPWHTSDSKIEEVLEELNPSSLIVEIKIMRENGSVVIRQRTSAFCSLHWTAGPDNGIIDRTSGKILKGFQYIAF